jgi:hypothetical protein
MHLPMDANLFTACMSHISIILGTLYDSASCIPVRTPVTFDRFLVLLLASLGKHLNVFTSKEVEFILRKCLSGVA